MAAHRPDGPVPGLGMARHGRPRRRKAPLLVAGIVTVLVLAGAGVFVLHAATAGAPQPGHGGGVASSSSPAAASAPASSSATSSAAAGGGATGGGAGGATVSVADVGDMNFGMDGRYPSGGAGSMIAGVDSHLRAGLTVGNMETALGSSGVTKCAPHSKDCFAFQAPASFAAAVRHAGFAAVNVANNHTDDAGTAGVQETDSALDAAHLRYTGRPGQTTYLVRHGIKIALLGFAPYSYDGDLLDIPAAVKAVADAAARAQLVIVFMHAGAEGSGAQHVRPGMETYLGEQRGDPMAFSHAVIDAGADLVLGSGPHVLRAMQWYHHRLIAYSLGNFVGYYTLGLGGVTADSAILHVRLHANGSFAGGSVTPVRLVGAGTPEMDSSGEGIRLINSLSRSDLGASGVRLTAAGTIEPPGP
jgi:poly-gamma-glutamate capsule biosynthesis protein CapA/YwtB (metallophosphatase superfamily)